MRPLSITALLVLVVLIRQRGQPSSEGGRGGKGTLERREGGQAQEEEREEPREADPLVVDLDDLDVHGVTLLKQVMGGLHVLQGQLGVVQKALSAGPNLNKAAKVRDAGDERIPA